MRKSKTKPMPRRTTISDEKKISFFSKNLRQIRLKKGLTQEGLAEKLGFSHSRISRFEAGTFPNNPEIIVNLADALDVSLDVLFGREAER